MKPLHRKAFEQEIASALERMREARDDQAFTHLERAHVLSQEYIGPHVLSHWLMLRIAVRGGHPFDALGQVVRIVLGSIGAVTGVVPTGNTGGSNVGMFKRMPIDPELADVMRGKGADGNELS